MILAQLIFTAERKGRNAEELISWIPFHLIQATMYDVEKNLKRKISS